MVVLGGGAIGLLSAMVFADLGFQDIHIAEGPVAPPGNRQFGNFTYDPVSGMPACDGLIFT